MDSLKASVVRSGRTTASTGCLPSANLFTSSLILFSPAFDITLLPRMRLFRLRDCPSITRDSMRLSSQEGRRYRFVQLVMEEEHSPEPDRAATQRGHREYVLRNNQHAGHGVVMT